MYYNIGVKVLEKNIMRESAISARIDFEKKKRVEEVFAKLGLTHSSAINLFYSQVLLHGGLPFETRLKESSGMTVAEPSVAYNQTGKEIMTLLSKFGKSKEEKAEIVKLALEYFLNEVAGRDDSSKESVAYDRKTILKKLRQIKKKYEKNGFVILGIFGSYARNEENESSDLDILYELSSDFRAKFKGFKAIAEINRIKEELENHFGMKIDLVDRSTQNSSEHNTILDEAVYV